MGIKNYDQDGHFLFENSSFVCFFSSKNEGVLILAGGSWFRHWAKVIPTYMYWTRSIQNTFICDKTIRSFWDARNISYCSTNRNEIDFSVILQHIQVIWKTLFLSKYTKKIKWCNKRTSVYTENLSHYGFEFSVWLKLGSVYIRWSKYLEIWTREFPILFSFKTQEFCEFSFVFFDVWNWEEIISCSSYCSTCKRSVQKFQSFKHYSKNFSFRKLTTQLSPL